MTDTIYASENPDGTPLRCCPGEDRLVARTKSGVPVRDLHLHRGMLKGYIAQPQGDAMWFWYVNGRISPIAPTPLDLDVPQDETEEFTPADSHYALSQYERMRADHRGEA